MKVPVFTSLEGYQPGWLRGDAVAGLTVWAVLVPEALAYASIAGVSPVVGMYAAPGALIFYAAFGSSRHLVTGPMAATAALSAAAVGQVAAGKSGMFPALTVTLALTTGLLAVAAGLAWLGFVANFISEPVLKGFIVGLALTIIVGQVPKLLGVSKGEGDFFDQLWHLVTHLGQAQGLTVLVGLGSLAVVLVLRRFAPVVPAPLVAVLAGILAVHIFGLDKHGLDIVGHISGGLPSFGLPHVPSADYLKLAGPAVGVMLVGFAEGLGAAKTYAARDGYQIDVNRELIGLGAANLGAGLSSGMVVNGSLSKTAVNGSAGARTQASGLVVAVLTVVTLWPTPSPRPGARLPPSQPGRGDGPGHRGVAAASGRDRAQPGPDHRRGADAPGPGAMRSRRFPSGWPPSTRPPRPRQPAWPRCCPPPTPRTRCWPWAAPPRSPGPASPADSR